MHWVPVVLCAFQDCSPAWLWADSKPDSESEIESDGEQGVGLGRFGGRGGGSGKPLLEEGNKKANRLARVRGEVWARMGRRNRSIFCWSRSAARVCCNNSSCMLSFSSTVCSFCSSWESCTEEECTECCIPMIGWSCGAGAAARRGAAHPASCCIGSATGTPISSNACSL